MKKSKAVSTLLFFLLCFGIGFNCLGFQEASLQITETIPFLQGRTIVSDEAAVTEFGEALQRAVKTKNKGAFELLFDFKASSEFADKGFAQSKRSLDPELERAQAFTRYTQFPSQAQFIRPLKTNLGTAALFRIGSIRGAAYRLIWLQRMDDNRVVAIDQLRLKDGAQHSQARRMSHLLLDPMTNQEAAALSAVEQLLVDNRKAIIELSQKAPAAELEGISKLPAALTKISHFQRKIVHLKGCFSSASDEIQRYEKAFPNDPTPYLHAASQAYVRGDNDDFLKYLEKLERLIGPESGISMSKSVALCSMGKPELGYGASKLAVQQDPNLSATRMNHFLLCATTDKFSEAIEQLKALEKLGVETPNYRKLGIGNLAKFGASTEYEAYLKERESQIPE